MRNCWDDEPRERPVFSTICTFFRELLNDWQVSGKFSDFISVAMEKQLNHICPTAISRFLKVMKYNV